MKKSCIIKRHFAIVFSIVTIFCFSCRPEALKHEAPAVNKVLVGSKFRVNLPEDHSTGYLWQLSSSVDPDIVEQLSTVWHGKQKGIDFNFKAIAAGQTVFTFIRRKFTDTSDIKSFVLKIDSK